MEQSSGYANHGAEQKPETAASAEQSLAKFNKDRYEIIVTDFATPGASGSGTGQDAKALPSKPVVLLTTFPPLQLSSEIDVLVIKPCDKVNDEG